MEYSSSFTIPSESNPGVVFEIHKPAHGRSVEFDRINADFRDRMRTQRKASDAIRDRIQADRDEFNTQLERELAEAKKADPQDSALITRLENGLEVERLRSILVNVPAGTPAADTQAIYEKLLRLSADAKTFEVPRELAEEQQALNTQTTLDIEGSYKPARIKWGLKSISGITIDGAPATADTLIQSGPRDLLTEIYDAIERCGRLSAEQLKNSQWPFISSAAVDGPSPNTTATTASSENNTAAETAANSPS